MTDVDRRRRVLAGLVLLATVAGILWWRWSAVTPEPSTVEAVDPPPTTEPATRPVARPDPCATPTRPFRPRTLTVAGVARRATVLGLPRDAAGVVGVPPVSAKGVVAWDRDGVRPGDPRGRVLLNAHTWPDGSALGNALLSGLQVGDRIVLRGSGDEVACYRVFRRVEVRETDGYPDWEGTDGPHQAAIVVCSGERLGPGRWTHRTLWFARPVVGPIS